MELGDIMNWSNTNNKEIILVGGWAVYVYNPWYGSIDIDLVATRSTRKSLENFLIEKQGFEPLRDKSGGTIFKPFANEQKIIIDFASKNEHYPFEGHNKELNFTELDGNTIKSEIKEDLDVTIPNRTLLLLFKTKAAWDRKYRIENNTSLDKEYEKAKLLKDKADILALLDGQRDININYLGIKFAEYDFLISILKEISSDTEAHRKYARLKTEECSKLVEDLLVLI